jgi:hypothetical protein
LLVFLRQAACLYVGYKIAFGICYPDIGQITLGFGHKARLQTDAVKTCTIHLLQAAPYLKFFCADAVNINPQKKAAKAINLPYF